MSECWRCAKEIVPGAKFCPSCGAPIGAAPSQATPAAPVVPEPADPLAQTAPADAAHMAALRAKHPALAPPKKETKPSRSRGGTVPLQAQPDRVSQTGPAASQAAGSERRVPRTASDENPIAQVPVPAASNPAISPRAVSALEPPIQGRPAAPTPPPPQPIARPPVAQPYAQPAAPQPAPQQSAWSAPTQPGPYGAPQAQGYGAAQPGPPQGQQPGGPPAAVRVGSRVFVEWADGNRYQGTVQQCAPGQCLVLFQDGQQRWIDARRVIPT